MLRHYAQKDGMDDLYKSPGYCDDISTKTHSKSPEFGGNLDSFLTVQGNTNEGETSKEVRSMFDANNLSGTYKLTPQVATRYYRAPELIFHNSF